MLKSSPVDSASAASAPSAPIPGAARGKVDQKLRRVSTAPCRPARADLPPAAKSVAAAPMPGVDAFGRVVDWTLFGTTARNERQAHQIDRANRAQASEMTQQQAELKAQLARSRSEHQTSGLARIQARRDAVHTVLETHDAAHEPARHAARVRQAAAQQAVADQQASAERQRAAGEGSVRGHAAPAMDTHGAPSEDEPRVAGNENSGNAEL